MSRERDPFRIHVHILPTKKWVCNFCGYEHRGSKTAIRAHLAGVAGYGIQGCKRVDDQVRSEVLTALNGKRAVKLSNDQGNVEECPHPLETVNDEDDWMVTSFAALPNLSTDVISSVGPSSSAFPPLPETVSNKDDWTDDWETLPDDQWAVTSAKDHWAVTLPKNDDGWSDLSSGVRSTVGASSSTFLPLPKTNLLNQSLPAQNMSPQRDFPFWPLPPKPPAVVRYIPRKMRHLINQRDLVPEDLTNMLCPEVEEPDTEVPQGTLSRDHKKKINYTSFDIKDSPPNGGIRWRKIGKIHVSTKEIAKGSNGTIVLEGIYEVDLLQ